MHVCTWTHKAWRFPQLRSGAHVEIRSYFFNSIHVLFSSGLECPDPINSGWDQGHEVD